MNELGYTRRGFLAASAAGAGALALPRLGEAARRLAHAGGAPAGYASFVSEPGLKPPTMTVNARAHPSAGLVFVATITGPGQRGPMIVDDRGRPVWFLRTKAVAINFRAQVYRGRPVLTWWEGQISKMGVGEGEGVVVDQNYRTIARVRAGNGFKADVHELLLTPQGTALITIYNAVKADLTSVGGPASGTVLDSIVQEVDVASGRVLFEWHSLDHVPIADTYSPVLDPFDYFHVNSIDVDLDGNLLLSARNTSAVYKVDRRSGAVLWRLGGRSSDFALAPDAGFMYQHDARAHPDGTVTLFDDGSGGLDHPARAIRLGLDLASRQCALLQEYVHTAPLGVFAMGNAQVLPGEAMLVGWGTQPYVTEFGPGGEVRFDAKFDGGAWNYRAFRSPWVGRPATKPALGFTRRGRTVTVHVSWNGSTQTAYWRLAAGPAKGALTPVKTVRRTGFETAIAYTGGTGYVAVTALDGQRRALATSAPRRVVV
jgi:hypothetical protein